MKSLAYMALAAVLAAAGNSAGADGYGDVFPAFPAYTPAYGQGGGYDWRLGGTLMLGVESHLDANSGISPGQDGGSGYGLGLKIGVPLDSLMPYAHFGYDRIQGISAVPGFKGSGANGGLGLLYNLAPHWSVDGEWSSAGSAANGLKFKSNSINFGVNYQFGSSNGAAPERQ